MFTIYIQDYNDNSGTFVSGPTVMFSIPSNNQDGLPVMSATVNGSEGSAESFDFSMESVSPFYNSMIQMRTRLRVDYDGYTIFYGRVLTINDQSIFQTRSVHCEGCLAFLNDTQYEGIKEEKLKNISIIQYFEKIIASHNSQIGSFPWKHVNKGNILFTPTSEQRKYEPTSWSNNSSLLQNMTGGYGGHIAARYSSGDIYLDWYKDYYRDLGEGSRPSISIGKNLIDFSISSEIENIFTRLIPIGSSNSNGEALYVAGYTYTDKSGSSHAHGTKYIPVSLLNSLYSDTQLNVGFHLAEDYRTSEDDYTTVYKTQSFPNADSQAKLWEYAIDYIKNNYNKSAASYSIKAIDMHVLNSSEFPHILVGDVIDVTYPVFSSSGTTYITRKLVCKTIQYDILNPENNTYTVGVPNEMLDHEYGNKKNHGSGDGASSYGGGGGGGYYDEPDKILNYDEIGNLILEDPEIPYGGADAYESYKANGIMTGTIYCYDPNEEGVGPLMPHPSKWIATKIVGRITHNTNVGIGFNSDRGVYAFAWPGIFNLPAPIVHYYLQESGWSYDDLGDFMVSTAQIILDPETGSFMRGVHTVLDGVFDVKDHLFTSKLNADSAELLTTIISDLTTDTVKATSSDMGDLIAKTVDVSVGFYAKAAEITETFKAATGLFTDLDADVCEIADLTTDTLKIMDDANIQGTIQATAGTFGNIISTSLSSDSIIADAITIANDANIQGAFTAATGAFTSLTSSVGNILGDLTVSSNLSASRGSFDTSVLAPTANVTHVVSTDVTADDVDTARANITDAFRARKGKVTNDAEIGKKSESSEDYYIVLNDQVTYRNKQGQLETKSGFVTADDFHISDTFDSVKTKLLVVDELIADRATIGQLQAAEARISSIEADYIRTGTIDAAYVNSLFSGAIELSAVSARFTAATCTTISGGIVGGTVVSGDTVNAGDLNADTITLASGNTFTDCIVDATVSGNTLTLTYASGATKTFSKAISSDSWSWVNGRASVTLQPQNQTFTSPLMDSYSKSGDPTWASDKKSFSQSIILNDEDGLTVFTGDLTFNTTDSWNAGNTAGYDSGYSVGYGAGVTVGTATGYANAKVSGSWNGGTYTASKGTSGNDSVSVTLAADITYDSSTHKYTAYCKTGSTIRGSGKTSGTEAYTAGTSAGYASAKVSGSWNGGTYTASKGTSGNDSVSVTLAADITYDSSTHKYTAYCKTGSTIRGSGKTSGTEAYDAGVTVGENKDINWWNVYSAGGGRITFEYRCGTTYYSRTFPSPV